MAEERTGGFRMNGEAKLTFIVDRRSAAVAQTKVVDFQVVSIAENVLATLRNATATSRELMNAAALSLRFCNSAQTAGTPSWEKPLRCFIVADRASFD